MNELHIIGVDLAKRVFQVHGSDKAGYALFRKKLSRPQFKKFLSDLASCTIAMEACATAHHWGREAEEAGHIVRLMRRCNLRQSRTLSSTCSPIKTLGVHHGGKSQTPTIAEYWSNSNIAMVRRASPVRDVAGTIAFNAMTINGTATCNKAN